MVKLAEITESFVCDLVYPNSAKFEVVPEHWIGGYDESASYCFECAEKKIEELEREKTGKEYTLDGGWDGESDSQPFCETCGKALSAIFTTYACESELDHFEENGLDLDDPGDCYSMERIMGSCGFYDDELTPRIKRVIRKAIAKASRPKKKRGRPKEQA